MSVGIVLELNVPVTIRQMRLFLSFVDDTIDIDADLRVGPVANIANIGAVALGIAMDEHQVQGEPVAPNGSLEPTDA